MPHILRTGIMKLSFWEIVFPSPIKNSASLESMISGITFFRAVGCSLPVFHCPVAVTMYPSTLFPEMV